jgi:tetratricopeptide (TPR) repeat protein
MTKPISGSVGVPRRNPEFDKLAGEAAAHHEAKRWAEAEASYRAALTVAPDHPAILHNLGVVAARQARHELALAWFDAALAQEPRYASAHYNRAVALEALGRRKEAIAGFARASALEPEHYASHRALGLLLLAEGDRDRALDHFARTYELRRGEDRTNIAAKSLASANRIKLLHDAAQFRHLAALRRDGARFERMARNYETLARRLPATSTALSAADFDALGARYNTAINIADAPEIPDGVLGPRPDRDELVRQFRNGPTNIVVLDDLLTQHALAALRRYLLESTIWHDFSHVAGFVAAYLEDGLACPLLLQLADELRRTFPDLLGPYPLSQAWAFKAVDPRGAVDIHADDGAVSLNFWVTPTEANRSSGGGLRVSRHRPPPDWPVAGYDSDRRAVVTFLERRPPDWFVVPYRENRAVLFESRLLHGSDAPEFAEGYENQRINITLLFGNFAADGR